MKGGWFALLMGAFAVLFSVIMRINILFQPNSLDILLWTTLYYTVIRYIDTNQSKWLYYGAVCFGVAFLNKYNIAFLFIGLVPALLITQQRRIFLSKQLYIAAGMAFLIILPNLIWQYDNGFPVIHHLDELERTQLVNVSRADFLQEQLLFFIGSIFVLILGLISFFLFSPFKKYQAIFWGFVFTLVIFIYFKAKGYYSIGLYPVILAFGSVYLEWLLRKKWLYYLRPVALLLPGLLFLPIVHIVFPVDGPAAIKKNTQQFESLGLLRWEDGKNHRMPQDFADMLGWHELAMKVNNAFVKLSKSGHTLVLCDNYGQAGAINFYAAEKNIQAVSMNADYINWFPLKTAIDNIILVKDVDDRDSTRQYEKQLFNTVYFFDAIRNPDAREYGSRIYILQNARTDVNPILQHEIDKRKW